MFDTGKVQRLAFYGRVSSEEQTERQTIQNQLEFAHKYADLQQLVLVREYLDDGVSGTVPLEQRPEGMRLLADARDKKIDAILVYKIDRLARKLKILLDAHEELQGCGVGIRSMTEPIDSTTPIGRFVFQLLGSIAELERETILERMTLGANRVAAAGKWLGGIVPYGYYVDKEGFLAISDEPLPDISLSEADVVRMIYRLLVEERQSCVKIADRLNALNVPTSYVRNGRQISRGKRKQNTSGLWTPGRIRNMVVEPTYRGIHQYGRRSIKPRALIKRAVPAIVDDTIWLQAQEQLRRNQLVISPQNAKREYLLRGIVKCGTCGLNYSGCPGHPEKHTRAFYRCNGRQSYRGRLQGKCKSPNIIAEEIEGKVWASICRWAENPGEPLALLVEQMKGSVADKAVVENDANRLQEAIAGKERERDVILQLLRKETITYAEGERHLNELGRELASLQELRDSKFARLSTAIDTERFLIEADGLLRSLREKIKTVDDPQKREIIETLVKEVVVKPDGSAEAVYRFMLPMPIKGTGNREDNRSPVLNILYENQSQKAPLLSEAPPSGDYIRQARLGQRIKQKELAARLGVVPSCVCNWEAGRTAPNRKQWGEIRRVLGGQ